MRLLLKSYVVTTSLIFFSGVLFAQSTTASNTVIPKFHWSSYLTPKDIVINVNIVANYYLYKDKTSVTLKDANGIAVSQSQEPEAVPHKDDFGSLQHIYGAGDNKWVFEKSGASPFELTVKYQGCSTQPFACYPPETFTEKLIPVKMKTLEQITKESTKASAALKSGSAINSGFWRKLINKGGIWIFIVAFLGGLFSVFTPCVLPLLPITLAVLGAGKGASKSQAIRRSFLYVSGIILTFTGLAIFAALTGKAFGSTILSNPTILLIFAIFFVIMSLSLLGLFDFQLPSSWSLRLNKVGGGSNLGAFLMGLVAGFIAIPCTGPILATLLGITAASANVFFGSSLLAVYAIGFGIPFFIVGIGLVRAPKSGVYMNLIKSFLGVVILILSIYILTIIIPSFNDFLIISSFTLKLSAIGLMVLGVLFGAFHGDGHSPGKIVKLLKLFGAILVAFGFIWLAKMPVGQIAAKPSLDWNYNLINTFTSARQIKKPILLDFTADWCAACKELENVTFADEAVKNELKNTWILARVDATKSSKELTKVLRKYKVKGFPTVILFSPTGKELGRFSGFMPPARFLQLLKKQI